MRLVCDKIAELKGLAAETVAAATTANAEALFRHPLHGKEYRTTMKKIKITVVRKVCHRDLIERYENPIDHACDMREGQVFVANGWQRPDGLCESAWQTISPFVMTLAHGGTDLYDGWMKNPASAMISCNDGFRPVSFLIETLD